MDDELAALDEIRRNLRVFGASDNEAMRLLAAIDAVLKQHECRVPVRIIAEYGSDSDEAKLRRYCASCSDHPLWPCPTVQAITIAMSA